MSNYETFSRPQHNVISPQNQASPLDFTEDLKEISHLQHIFNGALNITDQTIPLNYNPVLARWKFEKFRDDDQKIQKWRKHEMFQVETALRERNHAAKSAVNFIADENGDVVNEYFPDESYENVLERGIAYRMQIGSREEERERREVEGWKKIYTQLLDPQTPLHSKKIIISGPGVVEGTAYSDNYVDIYEVREDPTSRKRFIKMIRYASSLNYDQYCDKVGQIDPNYFEGLDGPIDAWFLAHPITDSFLNQFTADEIFNQLFESREKAMPEAEFQKIFQACLPVIQYYIDKLSGDNFDPKSIAHAWNAVLNKNDFAVELQSEMQRVKSLFPVASTSPVMPSLVFSNIQEEVGYFGRQEVKAVVAGCGTSSGFKIGSIDSNPIQSLLSNSVGKFALNSNAIESGESYRCPRCNKEYADETHVAPENRTKICNGTLPNGKTCNFRFNC